MSDIAARAGVSQTTVSFVLNGRSERVKIAEETRQRVLDTARDMGYRRNELARAMVTGKTKVVGFLTYNENSEHIWTIISGALDEAAIHGYSVKVQRLPFNGNEDETREVIHSCSTWRLDGLIALSLLGNAFELLQTETSSNKWSIVYVESSPEDDSSLLVGTDDYIGIRAAIEHLADFGHRRIAFMSGPMDRPLSVRRNAFFTDIMHDLFGPVNEGIIAASHWSDIEIVERSTQRMLDTPSPPTAMICAGDGAAMVAARVARNNGLELPGDLSIVGFGNFRLTDFADPPLTSIAQPFHHIGRVAMSHLIRSIESGENSGSVSDSTASRKVLLPTSLCVRESTGPPR